MLAKICFSSVDVEREGIEDLNKILDIFKKYDIPATLFVTGEILEKYTNLAKEWSEHYEIASHSFTHRFWNSLNFEERNKELDNFINIYQQIFQTRPRGFRAPSHLIDQTALELLDSKGFLYDSSVLPHYPPFKKYRGYQGKKPLLPYYPKGLKILEIPVRGQVFGIPLVGIWIRKLPFCFYQFLFLIYRPPFLTLNLHSFDLADPCFLGKIDKMIKLLKKKNYLFLNGEQILKNRQ